MDWYTAWDRIRAYRIGPDHKSMKNTAKAWRHASRTMSSKKQILYNVLMHCFEYVESHQLIYTKTKDHKRLAKTQLKPPP